MFRIVQRVITGSADGSAGDARGTAVIHVIPSLIPSPKDELSLVEQIGNRRDETSI